MDVRVFLKEHTLIFDGAMGSYLMTKYHRPADGCETTNLEAPEQVREVHQAYLASGCNAIKTNTFGANRLTMGEETCRKVIEAGWNIAKEAAGEAFVFADLGPVPMTDAKRALEEYRFSVDAFLKLRREYQLAAGRRRIDHFRHRGDAQLHRPGTLVGQPE